MFEEAVKRVLAKYICPKGFSYKPLRIITSLMKSSSFCCFRDRWYIMGNKAYNYIFHKVSFAFIVSYWRALVRVINRQVIVCPSRKNWTLEAGGGGGRGRGGDAEGVIFLSPFYPPGQTPVGMYSLPLPPPPEISFF